MTYSEETCKEIVAYAMCCIEQYKHCSLPHCTSDIMADEKEKEYLEAEETLMEGVYLVCKDANIDAVAKVEKIGKIFDASKCALNDGVI